MLDPDFGIMISVAMAALLLTAAWRKWRARADFAAALAAYSVLPHAALPLATRLTPALEVAVATGLLVRATRPTAAVFGCALMLAYAGAIAINLRRGRRDLDCGCAGPYDHRPIAPWMVARNLLLAAALGVVTVPSAERHLGLMDALTIGAGLASIALLYVAADQLLGKIVPRGAAFRRAS